MPGYKTLYISVQNNHTVFAVIGIGMNEYIEIDQFDRSILIAMSNEITLTIEKFQLNEKSKEAYMEVENGKNFDLIYCELFHMTCTTISGNANMLLSQSDFLDTDARHKLYEDIYDDAL